ncbi:hypothetical protein Hanom_Chr02g00122901 [Helianthus anomalus]
MFVPDCRRCPLPLNLTSFVLNVSKFCTVCPLSLTQLNFSIKLVYFCNFNKQIRVLLRFYAFS